MNTPPLLTPDSPAADHKDYAQPWGTIAFQKGAMELGRNGWTTAELLGVLLEHIGGFQKGKFACEENDAVLYHLKAALFWTELRAKRRADQGVKGRDGSHQAQELALAEEPMLRWFDWAHLPALLQEVSRPFGLMAKGLAFNLPRSAERTVALRKLLEAKDAAVRSWLDSTTPKERP